MDHSADEYKHAVESSGVELTVCRRQPGKLKITGYACALRYQMAQNGNASYSPDEFGVARKTGLMICRDCPQGRMNAKLYLED